MQIAVISISYILPEMLAFFKTLKVSNRSFIVVQLLILTSYFITQMFLLFKLSTTLNSIYVFVSQHRKWVEARG